MITNKDLYINKYAINELEENIENLGLWDILLTQCLTADFCFKYFWTSNDEYAKDKEDKNICDTDILNWQPHLTKELLYSCDIYKERLKKN